MDEANANTMPFVCHIAPILHQDAEFSEIDKAAVRLFQVPQSHYFSSQASFLDAGFLKSSLPQQIWVRGHSLQFLTGSGVFSKGALDEGSRLLIDAMPLSGVTTFGDLGCGWGAVGAFVAAELPGAHIYACDVNPRAVQLAQWNFAQNKLSNAVAWCGDGLSATRAEAFDCIACNPPIRAGNAVIGKLFDDSKRGLKIGGELWVVIRTAQGAKSWQKRLAEQFGDCETVLIKNGYRILKAIRSA